MGNTYSGGYVPKKDELCLIHLDNLRGLCLDVNENWQVDFISHSFFSELRNGNPLLDLIDNMPDFGLIMVKYLGNGVFKTEYPSLISLTFYVLSMRDEPEASREDSYLEEFTSLVNESASIWEKRDSVVSDINDIIDLRDFAANHSLVLDVADFPFYPASDEVLAPKFYSQDFDKINAFLKTFDEVIDDTILSYCRRLRRDYIEKLKRVTAVDDGPNDGSNDPDSPEEYEDEDYYEENVAAEAEDESDDGPDAD